jgi:molybdate transport system ATP-binding protein
VSANPGLSVSIRFASRRNFILDVSFEAPPGISILFGPSGSGKSTILGCIAGLIRPTQGRIALGETLFFDSTARLDLPIHRRKIAYVFQSLALFPHMTALANVEYGIDRSVPAAERRARARSMLERMKVAHLATRRPSTFSGGEAQRIALARAFVTATRVVLLDEPFSALDRDLRHAFFEDVRAFADEACIPIVHVTHHRNEARAIGDRAIMIRDGKLAATGTVQQLLPRLSEDR